MTVSPMSIRYPTMPCSRGVAPVHKLVSAVAVVVGATLVIGPPAMAERVGTNWA